MNDSDIDTAYMRYALALAKRHQGLTSSNPSVGCVIIHNHKVIGRGVTAIGGRPHAETIALEQAKDLAFGATVYVTLEPCSHYGKTPPCADALVKAGVKKVFIGILDIDERVNGKGLKILQDATIETHIGLCQDEIKHHHAPFFVNSLKKRPYYTIKFASSLDGKINFYPDKNRKQISSDFNILQSHQLRKTHHAIAVGIGTIIDDNPMLNCRIKGLETYSPDVIIFDNHCRITKNAKIFSCPNRRIFIFHAPHSAPQFSADNIIYAPISHDFDAINQFLLEYKIYSVLIEGGAKLQTSFLNAGLYDNIIHFQGNMIIGEQAQSAFGILEKPIFL